MRRSTLLFVAAVSLLAVTAASWGQDKAAMPMGGASMPQDCKEMMDQHAQPDGKGMATKDMKSRPCMAQPAASAASAGAPKRKGPAHDHTKFHKGQG